MKVKESVIIAIGLIAGAFVFGKYIYDSRRVENSIHVVGSATRSIESDIVKWRLTITRSVRETEITEGYRLLAVDVQSVLERLKQKGLKDEDIAIQSVNTFPVYAPGGQRTGYSVQQGILAISRNVKDIEQMAFDPKSVLSEGILLESSSVEYFSSDLATIKKELLKAAVIDARRRADEIAAGSQVRITQMSSASVGVFQITEPFSTEVSDYGINSTNTRKKDITVTVRANFLME